MAETETRSFAICSITPNAKQAITINKAHVNLWLFSAPDVIVDIGLQIEFSQRFTSPIVFQLYTPFLTSEKQKFEDLYSQLSDKLTVQLIFNDSVLEYTVLDENALTDDASLIKFANKRPMVLVKPQISRKAPDKIELTIDPSNINNSKIPEGAEWYLRFRFKTSSFSNVYISDQGGFHDKVYFDVRFNEPRQLPKGEIRSIQAGMLRVKSFYLFMMQDMEYKLSLNQKRLEYVRFLETEGFLRYMPELQKLKTRLLVYFWKIPMVEKDKDGNEVSQAANMVIGFEKEKQSIKQFRSGVFVNVFSTAILLGSEMLMTLKDIPILNYIGPVINLAKNMSFLIFICSLLYAVYAAVSYVVSQARALWHKIKGRDLRWLPW